MSQHIEYRRINTAEIFALNCPDDSTPIELASNFTVGIFSIDVFPPAAEEVRTRVSVMSRDLCGISSSIYENLQGLQHHISRTILDVELPFETAGISSGCGLSLLFEVELSRTGEPTRYYWVIYPITNSDPQIKRLRLRQSNGPFDAKSVYEQTLSEQHGGPSCFVHFSLRETESPVKVSSRVSMTPLNLTPRVPETVIDMDSVKVWAKSWINSSSSTQASIDVSDMKSRILSKVMSRYSR